MNYLQLTEQIKRKRSFLCVGLDTDIHLIPEHLMEHDDPIFEFNKNIIDYTHKYTVAYKPNTAFYERLGAEGWRSLEKTVHYLKSNFPEIMIIADAKRGDIGNTSKMYAGAFFQNLGSDAVTVAPYMGEDSVKPFLEFKDKWVILLALTSNKGAYNFQMNKTDDIELYKHVISTSQEWGSKENMMYVIGATKAEMLKEVRELIPEHFLLVPGVGAQGGSLEAVVEHGINDHVGLLINSSRGIIYSDVSERYAVAAGNAAREIQQQMDKILQIHKIV